MEFKDYYKTLGVTKASSEKDLKQAYRKLARKHHPDVNPGDKKAEDRFKDCAEAFEVLSDPEKRRLYDQFGHEGPRGAGCRGIRGARRRAPHAGRDRARPAPPALAAPAAAHSEPAAVMTSRGHDGILRARRTS